MRGKSLRIGVALNCGIALCGCSSDEERPAVVEKHKAPPSIEVATPDQPAGHRKMVATLARLANRSKRQHYYLGSDRLEAHRAKLKRLGDAADWQTRLEAAQAELDLGHERASIDILDKARRDLQSGRIPGRDEAIDEITFHLGVAYFRLAETANCCKTPVAESCILPILDAAQHRDREGSSQAASCFLEVARSERAQAQVRHSALWLLNLAHLTLGDYPDAVPEDLRIPKESFAATGSFPNFENVAPGLGLDTFSLSGGVVADDFDADGDIDLMVSTWDTSGQLRLFENLDDRPGFVERTAAAGLNGLFGGLNLVHADYDNDGDLDVLVLRGAWLFGDGRHPNSLLRNNGDLTFTDVTREAGLTKRDYPTQTGSWSDFDLDGDLDLYIGNEHSSQFAAPSQLFENRGDGTFVDVAKSAGVTNDRFAKSVAWGDFDDDGWPDLYVSNNGQANRLYRNHGDGTFRDVAQARGVTGPAASFPAWFWDVDNDGALDLYVSCYGTDVGHIAAHYRGTPFDDSEVARLYRGDGSGGFREVGRGFGLDYPAMPMGSNYGDLDGDGFLDAYLGTGNVYAYSVMPNVMLRNTRGMGFEDVTITSGLGHLQKGHGIAFADFDNDGDLDVFSQMGGAYKGDAFFDALYENPGTAENRSIRLRLVGTHSNRFAIGAKIRIDVEEADGTKRTIYRHVSSGGSFGASPLGATIGLGPAARVASIHVTWPDTSRSTQTVLDIAVDRAVRITEGTSEPEVSPLAPRPLF